MKAVGIASNYTILVHSSMKSIGHVEKGADDVLDAFIEYCKRRVFNFPDPHLGTYECNLLFNPIKEPSDVLFSALFCNTL